MTNDPPWKWEDLILPHKADERIKLNAKPKPECASPEHSQGDLIVDLTAWFASEMRTKLFQNINRPGWRGESERFLLERLEQELVELQDAIKKGEPWDVIASEAADVANFAMMLADPGRAGNCA